MICLLISWHCSRKKEYTAGVYPPPPPPPRWLKPTPVYRVAYQSHPAGCTLYIQVLLHPVNNRSGFTQHHWLKLCYTACGTDYYYYFCLHHPARISLKHSVYPWEFNICSYYILQVRYNNPLQKMIRDISDIRKSCTQFSKNNVCLKINRFLFQGTQQGLDVSLLSLGPCNYLIKGIQNKQGQGPGLWGN